jgi:hypothetical protein
MALAQYTDTYWFPSGTLAASIPARVFEHAVNTLATLWADAAGTIPLANPATTSAAGVLTFWAEEGEYWVHIDTEAFEIAVGAAAQPVTQADLTTALASKISGAGAVTDNAVARFDDVTGLVLTDSTVTIADDGSVVIAGSVDLNGHVHVHDILVGIGTATTDPVISVRVDTDTARRIILRAGGTIEFGGGVVAPDTNLYRPVADTLATDGDFVIQGTGKAYRFRRGGGALDTESGGADWFISTFPGGDFTGVQNNYLRLESGTPLLHVTAETQFNASAFGARVHTLDGVTDTVGFHGSGPVGQATITGSRGGNAALASLLTALAARGDIIDNTVA